MDSAGSRAFGSSGTFDPPRAFYIDPTTHSIDITRSGGPGGYLCFLAGGEPYRVGTVSEGVPGTPPISHRAETAAEVLNSFSSIHSYKHIHSSSQ